MSDVFGKILLYILEVVYIQKEIKALKIYVDYHLMSDMLNIDSSPLIIL